jgi:SpoVK/Ycf46/Vps4 family AAA+-type ATPase
VADSEKVARAFAQDVCAFCNDPRRSVLLYSGGCWSKSSEVWQSIQDASFDDLILAGDLKERIKEDFTTFLAARADYARYGVPYKRGVLFLGPPGNGKTLCLRATLKLLEVPVLYVMSLKAKYSPEDANIGEVFKRAREVTPCCLVFEDLDAMIHDKNRSFFLNQLDGIGNLSGVLTIATTNHPDRLDPAIVERPSRFDRKYHFGLPAAGERAAYLEHWNKKLDDAMRISKPDMDRLVEETSEFSFAYLKELYLSAMVRWMIDRKTGSMPSILQSQLQVLREQMRTGASAVGVPIASPTDPDLDD